MTLVETCDELEEHLELRAGFVGSCQPVNDGACDSSLGHVAALGDVLRIVVDKHLRALVALGELQVIVSTSAARKRFVDLKARAEKELR